MSGMDSDFFKDGGGCKLISFLRIYHAPFPRRPGHRDYIGRGFRYRRCCNCQGFDILTF